MKILVNGIQSNLRFSSAHVIPGHESCGYIHGHSYFVDVEIEGERAGDFEFVVDFKDVKAFTKAICDELDHRLLIPVYNDLIECEQWIESDSKVNLDDIDFEYEMSLCLMCGCCVEACPNYDAKEFVGTPIAVSASKLVSLVTDSNHLKDMKNKYSKKFYSHCVKSIACEDVCPMGIETQRAISKMNKKAVWKLWQLISRD